MNTDNCTQRSSLCKICDWLEYCVSYRAGFKAPNYPMPAIPVLFDPITALHQGVLYRGVFIEHAITGETLNWYE